MRFLIPIALILIFWDWINLRLAFKFNLFPSAEERAARKRAKLERKVFKAEWRSLTDILTNTGQYDSAISYKYEIRMKAMSAIAERWPDRPETIVALSWSANNDPSTTAKNHAIDLIRKLKESAR